MSGTIDKSLSAKELNRRFQGCVESAHRLIHPFSVAIATHKGSVEDDSCSGTLVRVSGRSLILTCGHFLSDHCTEDLRIVYSEKSSSGKLHIPRIAFINECETTDPIENDLGYIELDTDSSDELSFLAEERLEQDIVSRNEDILVIAGFPACKIREALDGARAFDPATVSTVSTQVFTRGITFDSRIHLKLEYPDEMDAILPPSESSMPEVSGMSGGGIWSTLFSAKHDLWDPSMLKLIGTAVEYDRDNRIVLGIGIGESLALVNSTRMLAPGTSCYKDGKTITVVCR